MGYENLYKGVENIYFIQSTLYPLVLILSGWLSRVCDMPNFCKEVKKDELVPMLNC
jgi:hypothetical protein